MTIPEYDVCDCGTRGPHDKCLPKPEPGLPPATRKWITPRNIEHTGARLVWTESEAFAPMRAASIDDAQRFCSTLNAMEQELAKYKRAVERLIHVPIHGTPDTWREWAMREEEG